MFLNFLGLLSFLKPTNRKIDWKPGFPLSFIIENKHFLISIFTGLMGIILLAISFSLPWYYHLLRSVTGSGGYHYNFLYFKDAINMDSIFTFYLFYAYLLSLSLLFIKISTKGKLRNLYLLEIAEILFIIPGLILIFNIKYSPPIFLAIFVYIKSGFYSGFILYTIGISVLILNGLQFSIYSRLRRKFKSSESGL